ncbi:MAG: proton-conducting transporter membrane subunit [Terricaulis sp.]
MTASLIEIARAHAPLLLLTTPLLAAALILLAPISRLSWAIGVAAMSGNVFLAMDAATRHLLAGPWGGDGVSPLAFDGLGLAGAAIIACTGALAVIAAGAVMRQFEPRERPLALALSLCVCGGWQGALVAQDLLGVFLASETAWLASVALVSLSSDRGALNGAMRMISAGAASAALFLLGAALLMRGTGVVRMSDLPLAQIAAPMSSAVGAALIVVSLAVKAALAPFHGWLAAALGRTSAFAAIMLASVGVVGALAVTARFAAYAIPAPSLGESVTSVLTALGVASVGIGSLQAIGAANVRRLAAYAGVAQGGGVLLALGLGSPAGFAAALLQMAALAAAGIAVLGGVAASGCKLSVDGLDGLGRRAPLSGAAMLVGALSLMGAPLTLGFLGRWRAIEAAVGVDLWWSAGMIIAASLAGAIYAGRLIERLYFRRAATPTPIQHDPWRVVIFPVLFGSVLALALGLEPSVLLRAAQAASLQIAGEAP